MKMGKLIITVLMLANFSSANELQQKYEKAYYLETAKGQNEPAAIIYREISKAESSDENKAVIKQSLLRLLKIATTNKSESTIQECHEKLLQKTDATLQELVDATQAGGTVYVPAGRYEGTITLDKNITLKGADQATCILEATSNKPLIHILPKNKVRIESLSLGNQLETSERTDPPGCTLVAKDSTVTVVDCTFKALGDSNRSPCAVLASGFSAVDLQGCRFTGYEYTIQYSSGAKGWVTDCIVRDPGHCGITVGSDCEVEITGNIVTGSRYHGIRCTGGTLFMKDNLIIQNRNRGIYLGSKSAHGTISNNAIIGNGAGISCFASADVEIENNVIIGNRAAGIDTRGSCEIELKNNILTGNITGFIVYEGGNNHFRVAKNTFWENETTSTDFTLPGSTIEENPMFKNPTQGKFAVGNKKVKSTNQGLTDPNPISNRWNKYIETCGGNPVGIIQAMQTAQNPSEKRELTLQQKVDDFDIKNAGRDEVLNIFGEPEGYFFEKKQYKKTRLPSTYTMIYPGDFNISMHEGKLKAFIFEENLSKENQYNIGGIKLGISLNKALGILGKPKDTEYGKRCTYDEGVLFRNSSGQPYGSAYYNTKGVILFFSNETLIKLHVTNNTILGKIEPKKEKKIRGDEKQNSEFQAKINDFDMERDNIDDILRIFGEPMGYFHGQKKYKKRSVPEYYAMTYSGGFSIWMHGDYVDEFRFGQKPSDDTYYEIGGITVGTSLAKVLKILGKPKKTVNNRECTFEEKILYKNSKGSGFTYYSKKGLRLFFSNEKVCGLYVTDNTILNEK